jgi:hypothetical protein
MEFWLTGERRHDYLSAVVQSSSSRSHLISPYMETKQPLPRRAFLNQLSSAGAAVMAVQWPAAAGFWSSTVPMDAGGSLLLDRVTQSIFSKHLNSTFRVRLHSGEVLEARLADTSDRSSPSGGDSFPTARTPFSLLFKTAQGALPDQGIYRVEHDHLGTLDLFLVPVGFDNAGKVFEAVFA